jgi:hypothetical protein
LGLRDTAGSGQRGLLAGVDADVDVAAFAANRPAILVRDEVVNGRSHLAAAQHAQQNVTVQARQLRQVGQALGQRVEALVRLVDAFLGVLAQRLLQLLALADEALEELVAFLDHSEALAARQAHSAQARQPDVVGRGEERRADAARGVFNLLDLLFNSVRVHG